MSQQSEVAAGATPQKKRRKDKLNIDTQIDPDTRMYCILFVVLLVFLGLSLDFSFCYPLFLLA